MEESEILTNVFVQFGNRKQLHQFKVGKMQLRFIPGYAMIQIMEAHGDALELQLMDFPIVSKMFLTEKDEKPFWSGKVDMALTPSYYLQDSMENSFVFDEN